MRAEDFASREDTLEGWPVRVVSYRLGPSWFCTVDNVDPGARVAHGEGVSREEAERMAVATAARRLGRTRRH